MTTSTHRHPSENGKSLTKLAIGAIGVVYGDIGTSPLYAIKESFHPSHGIAITDVNILGILSLVFWALTLVVTVKYLSFILKADNHGEGGTTALLALLLPKLKGDNQLRQKAIVVMLAVFGAGLLYGDGVITPAISVLSAIEGLSVSTPAFQPMVVPITIAILVLLFSAQKKGTAGIGAIFGPITLIWFVSIAAAGVPWIIKRPDILQALNPYYAIRFFQTNGMHGFWTLSSVVLCITGAEALYADMGHFGKKPIRLVWFAVVLPCLLLNYLGQGALVLEKGPEVIENTFYGLVSGWVLYPMVAIATLATVIASQAMISGAFSLTQQSVQLGFLPRMTILHTSREAEGQIYVPKMNLFLMVSCILLILTFQESTNLAAAYGIAVTGTMVITSIMYFLVARKFWGWRLIQSGSLLLLFLSVDLSFFLANITKLWHGGWIPILIGLVILTIMTTWKRGRDVLAEAMSRKAIPLSQFFDRIERENPHRVRGTAVFMTLTRDIAPAVLLHHYSHNQTLHEKIILLSIVNEHRPEVESNERVRVTDFPHGFVKVVARYGYMETPDILEILSRCESAGLRIDYAHLSYYLGRESFVTSGYSGMPRWRKAIFIFLSRNARSATEFFRLPPDRVIEIGSQIQI